MAGVSKSKRVQEEFSAIWYKLLEANDAIIKAMDRREVDGSILPISGTQKGFEWDMLHAAHKANDAAATIMFELGNLTGRYDKKGKEDA